MSSNRRGGKRLPGWHECWSKRSAERAFDYCHLCVPCSLGSGRSRSDHVRFIVEFDRQVCTTYDATMAGANFCGKRHHLMHTCVVAYDLRRQHTSHCVASNVPRRHADEIPLYPSRPSLAPALLDSRHIPDLHLLGVPCCFFRQFVAGQPWFIFAFPDGSPPTCINASRHSWGPWRTCWS